MLKSSPSSLYFSSSVKNRNVDRSSSHARMGQTLSEPITAKESASLQNSKVKVGSSSMQGWRVTMEDAHTHLLKLNEDPDAMFFGGELFA
jgi:hypothetical protein